MHTLSKWIQTKVALPQTGQRAHSGDTAAWRNQLRSMYSEMSIIDQIKTHTEQIYNAPAVSHEIIVERYEGRWER